MGVWERSPAGLALANASAGLQASFRDTLPDLRPDDVIGSPYCVRRYVVDASFGGPEALAAARAVLAARGIRLLLDYVPNHVAPDHPWVTSHPELFVRGSESDIEADPAGWVRIGEHVLAHGRDPYFPPWPDVVQLNAFSPALRAATVATLQDIAGQCDGMRCDMAMLMTNQVFARTWGGRAGPEPAEEFWPSVLGGLRRQHPATVLVAEAYWDMEWELQQQGFGFCYDKRLYDRIVAGDVAGIRDHLRAGLAYQSGLVRFLENHDEPRIATLLPVDAERAAAVAIATLPGATLWHEGQFEGRRVRPPVFLSRRPDEALDPGLADWYRRLLAIIAGGPARPGPARPGPARPGPARPGPARPARANRGVAAARGERLARQPVLPPPCRLVLGRGRTTGTSWSSTSPISPRKGRFRCPGRTCPATAGASPTASGTACSTGMVTCWPIPACSWTWGRGSATCSPWSRISSARTP